jgi:hypothetical protein
MGQYSMRLARPATGRTIEPPAPDMPPAPAPQTQERIPALHGVMTGLANLVNEQLGRLTIGPQATRFLRHLERQTFGNAGLHRRAGRSDPGLWCPYDHAAWAATLGLSSSALTHLRARLVEAGILWYTPDPERRGQGAVGWDFDFASWKPGLWGGARTGAGRPRAAPSSAEEFIPVASGRGVTSPAIVRGAEEHAPMVGPDARILRRKLSRDEDGPPASKETGPHVKETGPHIQDVNGNHAAEATGEFKMSTGEIQDVHERESRRQRPQIKMSTTRLREPGPCLEPVGQPRSGSPKKENKESRRTDADASGVASTPRAALAASDSFHDPPDTEPRQSSTPAPRAQPPPATGYAGALPAGEPLPSPLPYETLRSYWLRIYREASAATGQEARPMVHAAARALLNMGCTNAGSTNRPRQRWTIRLRARWPRSRRRP